MGTDQHDSQDAERTIAIHIIEVVKDTTADGSGPSSGLLGMMGSAGMKVSGPERVSDSPQAIRTALDAAIQSSSTQCVLVCADTPASVTEGPADVVADCIERPLPGFGELVRSLAFEDIGAAAMLSRACGGIARHTLVFSPPSETGPRDAAIQRLILPALQHLDEQSAKEGLLQDASLSSPVARGWQAATAAMGGTLVRDAWPSLPTPLAEHAAIQAVMDTAGQRGVLACTNRRRYSVFGFPDLQRPTSKVLLTGDGGRSGYVLALHRFPNPVGILGPGAPDLLPAHNAAIRQVCREVTGSPLPDEGYTVFAVDKGRIYVEKEGAIGSWDGRSLEDEGLPGQAAASLVLRWSQR